MNEFKSVILGICIASVSLGAMYMLKPDGNTAKTVRFGFAVIFLTLTLSIFISLFGKSDRLLPTLSITPDYSAAEKITAIEARQIAAQVLEEKGIKFKEIDVLTNKDEAHGISIKRITVKTDETAEQVRQSISAVIKTDGVEVINE